ncbi:hypothetical protein V8C86DRAFT_689054 [Haematococcus lacustris]
MTSTWLACTSPQQPSLVATHTMCRYLRKHDPVLGQAKNRLGQKARRALYEKKYGTAARHLQAQTAATAASGSGAAAAAAAGGARSAGSKAWAPRAAPGGRGGATYQALGQAAAQPQSSGKRFQAGGKGVPGGAGRGHPRYAPGGSASTGMAVAVAGEPAGSGPLHPSWEARKQAKARLAASRQAAAATPATKITFGEDGSTLQVVRLDRPGARQAVEGRAGAVDSAAGRPAAVQRGGAAVVASKASGITVAAKQSEWQKRSRPGHGKPRPAAPQRQTAPSSARQAMPAALQRRDSSHGLAVPHGTAGDANVHPSWAAKQRQKQLQSLTAAPAAGNKIVFDD